ncbi:head GIN domain-containing protein [Formosa sp. PL04]|uniref:head GIN domain-containing protein n=1 Tax=Formosa sp. PL04 TaxID=3081755 RepID=UPI0029812479|nr:head GIN domain-containing protein [Formosa sp. PL04]MDW5288626.1 head GIN domain-containing protein [Formosa sp. PL04]
MKTLILKRVCLMAVLAVSVNSCAQFNKNAINGNGDITTIKRTTSTYDGIKCSGSMDFVLVQGTEGNITIQGESNLLPYIETEVHSNVLIVKVKDGVNIKTTNRDIVITIPFETISEVSLTGSGDLVNKNTINAEELKVGITGSGDVILDVITLTSKASITGSGDLTLKGKTENLEVNVTGSGDFHGFGLESKITDVSVTGSGDAEVVSSESIKGRVSGSGDITYKGNPAKEDTKVSGSGSIEMN